MAKNFKSLYSSKSDATALNQDIFIVEETERGVIKAPVAADYFDSLAGGSIQFSQPFESSPQRSGRHNNSIIKGKKTLSWSYPSFVNIDTALSSPILAEIDKSFALLNKSALGHEDTAAGPFYDSSEDPHVTFSIFENGDVWAKQARGCFVDQAEYSMPGDGRSQVTFSGMGAEALTVGIGKVAVTPTGNTLTVGVGEGKSFPVGALVMIVKADGVTRSADTPTGSPRMVTAVLGDVVTIDGAILADVTASSGSPIYLAYYEPVGKVAISNPQTGLQGSVEINGLTEQCIRSITVTIANNHELEDYCFGYDSVHGRIFTAASRLTVTCAVEMNLNADVVRFINSVQQFEGKAIEVILGDELSRHMRISMPRVIFQVPEISVPENGSVPITFQGTAYQSVLDAADEITVAFE